MIRRRFLVIAVALAATAALGWSPAAQAATPTPAIPLASGVSTPSQSSVVLPMGHLGDPDNTFWQLFLRPAGAATWTLETPPGVADNGGLIVAAPAIGPTTAGFLPSQLLRFSPLAQTSDGGTTWTPGALPSALVAAPDALAGGSSSTSTMALVTGSGQSVLSGSLGSGWRVLVTSKTLARASTGCGVERITAVANNGTVPILGVQCSRTGRIGVLVAGETAGPSSVDSPTWTNRGPLLSGRSPGTATVLRLTAESGSGTGGTSGVAGLATVRSGRSSSVVAFWSEAPGAGWTQSRRLVVPAGWTIAATATGGGSTGKGATVLLASGKRRRVASVAGPSSGWALFASPPAGTQAVVTVGSQLEAFVVDNSRLTVWAVTTTGGWRRVQTSNVPVPYGSSS